MKSVKKLKRYVYFFYYTKKSQIVSRFISKVKRPLLHNFIINKKYQITDKYNYFVVDTLPSYDNVSDLLVNKFTFLNQPFQFDSNVNWSDSSNDDLWNFHLNYFDYLSDFINEYSKSKDFSYIQKGQSLVEEWIKSSINYSRVTWSPYTISLRLINWITFYSKLVNENCLKSIPENVIKSIIQQNDYLKSNLEYDVLGNHLFENVKTIILVEHFLGNKTSTQKYVYKLNKILSKQILKDGCHFEKSMSYHIIVMNGIADVLNTLKEASCDLKVLTGYLKLMHSFYKGIAYNELDYPLFNDSNYTMTERLYNLENKIKKVFDNKNLELNVKTLNKKSNYFIHKTNTLRLTMDLGSLGAEYLLAHAHNDIFNFELLHSDKKFVIDTGVYEYKPTKKREYSRSTCAHNTVQVSSIEQSDIWSSFRIAYRPSNVYNTVFLNNTFSEYFGSYNHKKNYTHSRNFIITKKDTVIINDIITSKYNYDYKSFLHLHPNVLIKDDNNYLALVNSAISVYLYTYTDYTLIETNKLDIVSTKYYPYFGKELDKQTIINKNDKDNCGFIFSLCKIKDILCVANNLLITYENGYKEKLELRK